MINLLNYGMWLINNIYLVSMVIETLLLISDLQEIIKYGLVVRITQLDYGI